MTLENTSLAIDAPADPQGISYTPDAPVKEAPKAEAKPLSSREALEKAADDLEAKGVKIGNERDDKEPEDKAKPEPKEAKPRTEGGKFAPKEATENTEPSEDAVKVETEDKGTEQEGETDKRPSEERDIDKPPARFLPRAKEKWAEADPDIRGEVRRMEANYEKGLQEHRESHEFRKELREFEDMAKEHGTTVKDALKNYTAIDNLLKTNPVAGVERILSSIGITPQQYADYVQNAPAQAPADPKVSQLEQTVRQLQQQLQGVTQTTQESQQQAQLSQVQNNIIAPFRASLGDNDRYEELEEDIAFFLNSDKVPSTLSAQRRLEVAYDMAERINPVGQMHQNTARLNTATPERPINPAGAKSIKGAPNGTAVPKGATLKSREAIEAAMRQIGL